MFSKVKLFNQALTTVGNASRVSDPDSSTDKSAITCSLWFEQAVLAVTTAHHWPCVRKIASLSRVKTRDEATNWVDADPAPGFIYTYALPYDCVRPQYLSDFSRFELGRTATEKVLYSNQERAILYYSFFEPNLSMWDADFYRAVRLSLSGHINMALSGKLQLTQKLENNVREVIEMASVAAANSDDTYYESVPSSWAGTGFAIRPTPISYFYPTETFRVSL